MFFVHHKHVTKLQPQLRGSTVKWCLRVSPAIRGKRTPARTTVNGFVESRHVHTDKFRLKQMSAQSSIFLLQSRLAKLDLPHYSCVVNISKNRDWDLQKSSKIQNFL